MRFSEYNSFESRLEIKSQELVCSLMDTSTIPKKYPYIAKIFSEEWFKSEFEKEKKEMHLLAKQFTYNKRNEISLHHIDHLEEYLETMKDELKLKEGDEREYFFKRLKNSNEYNSALAEIEIGSLCKKMGFQIELWPPISDSERSGDIKIIDNGTEVFIEVSIKKGPKINYNRNFGLCKAGKFKFHRSKNFKGKIKRKSYQLSEHNPGIIALHLDPSILNRMDIVKAFYDGIAWMVNGEVVYLENGESTIDISIISAILLYSHCFSDGCKIDKELHLNPKANIPLPDSVITKFRDGGIEIKEEPIELERNSP